MATGPCSILLHKHFTDDFELLLKSVANASVDSKVGLSTPMPSDAFSYGEGDVIAGFQSVNECVPEHVTSKVKGLEIFVQYCRARASAKLLGVLRQQPR